MEAPEVIREALAQHNATDQYWLLYPDVTNFKYTDGVKAMAQMCEAYWLITDIFAYQMKKEVRGEAFQVWRLILNDEGKGDGAVLVCEDGNYREVHREEISYTDFPLAEGIKLYMDGGVLLLPSEY
jgi:hypothetical protein